MTHTNNPTILIIDDTPAIIASLSAILRPQYRVLVARTGEAGLNIARNEPKLSLILLDVVMPGLDGYAVLAALRESVLTSDIPVVLLTSLADASDEERGFELGASDYISKPIKPTILLARVRSQIEVAAHATQLAANEQRLRAIINGSLDAILAFDQAGMVQSINTAGVTMFGYHQEEIVQLTIGSLVPEMANKDLEAFIQDHFLKSPSGPGSFRSETEGRRKDGSLFPMDLALSRARSDAADIFVGFTRDLSPQRKAEAIVESLRRERVTAIGGMAVALAHEINQPFLATVAYLNTARQLLATPLAERSATVEETLDLAADQIVRAGHIISHLREFVSSGEPNKTFQKLHDLIRDALAFMIDSLRSANIEATLQLDAENDLVLADKFQIKQVMANLFRNARQAMSNSNERQLRIATSSIECDMIRIDVIDTGSGIPDEVKARLFEPFATTKDYGMGVGLSISRSIIEAHFGEIWADQNPFGGAVFSFTLPLAVRGEAADE
jgi:PAS domain S-box-containing protein